jgi:HlyD family type I secretion membrane fusion protein
VAKVKESAIALAGPKRDTNFSAAPIIWVGVAILVIFFGGIALWATLVPLHAAVHARGEVVFQNKRQTVQHQEGGIVKQILVKNGDTVKAGQPLIVLDDDMVKPIVDMYEGQALAETATIIRLEAEKNGRRSVTFPEHIPSPIVQTETKLFNAKRQAYRKQIDVIKSQIDQNRAANKGTKEQLASKKQEIASLKEQLEANQSLLKEGYVTKTVVLNLQRVLAEKTGEREQISANIATTLQRVAELEQRILAIRADRVQQAANEIKNASMKRIELEERVRPSRAMLAHQIIRAPVAGTIVGLKVTTVGGVVTPREPLMEIAPQEDHLIVEGKIGVNDISDVKLGQEAKVTMGAFKSWEYPPVKAQVTYVSADRLTLRTAQGEMPYYSAYLEIDPEALKSLKGLLLVPGMQASVAITTKPRTALDYFIGPLRNRIGKALHAK